MRALFEPLFEFLFKYRPLEYSKGDFAFGAPASTVTLVVVALIIGIAATFTYFFVRGESGGRDRLGLILIRSALLALLAFCLLRPGLSVPALLDQRGYVAVLIDDSRSMRVQDEDGSTRAQVVRSTFARDTKLRRQLEERFHVRYYHFSDRAAAADPDSLNSNGGATDIGGALEYAVNDLAGLPLAGVVIASDGVDNTQRDIARSLLPLRAEQVPVFTMAVGRSSGERDLQVSRVALPVSVLKDARVLVDVEIRHTGFSGRDVVVDIQDAGRLLARETVALPRGVDVTNVALAFPATEAGPRQLRVRVRPAAGEKLLTNNERSAFLDVRDGREKILMVEGEPRFETKFLRRAIADEKHLQLVVLQRTAPDKFLRLDVDSAGELAGGFPTTRAELFSYRALVLGSIEASFFTHEQMRMIAEFVSRRGGGLLMLGGANSFGEGGWAGTPVAEALPVALERGGGPRKFLPVSLRPTDDGIAHPLVRIDTATQLRARWNALPQLSTANVVGGPKQGARVLLAANDDDAPALTYQHYGRGIAVAFTAQDSWLWQMHHDMAVDDQTHEMFWRQLLRYLVQDTPDPARVVTPAVAAVGQPLEIAAIIEDSAYVDVAEARVQAIVRAPDGTERSVALARAADGSGAFRGALPVTQPGLHEVTLDAMRGETPIRAGRRFINVSGDDIEFFDADARPGTLQRIADETGGRAYTAANISALPEDIRLLGQGLTVHERRDLWDMPAIFIALLLLACAEWLYRRRKGLI